MDTEQNHIDADQPKEPVVETAAGSEKSDGSETTASPTPLRQLLHWATGDREAEAKALADETLALREPDEKDKPTADPEPGQALLSAAKRAVSVAHGDSVVPNEFVGPSTANVTPKTTDLSESEDENSFSENPTEEETTPAKIDADVARPTDVEGMVEAAN